MRLWILSLSIVFTVTAPNASAQVPNYLYPNQFGPYQRPAVSPYLNILNNPNPAIGYYLGKVSETDRRAFQSNIGAFTGLPTDPGPASRPLSANELGIATLEQTGHTAVFLNYAGYFQQNTPMRTYNPFPPARPFGR